MSKKWRDILTDSTTYGDDFVISLKDGQTMSLGEMRAYDTESKGAMTAHLTAKEQELSKRELDIRNASIGITQLIEKTASAVGVTPDELIEGKLPTRRAVAAATELDENDPLVGAVIKRMNAMQAKLDAQDTEIKKTREQALGPMLNTYLEDYYETKWEKLEPSMPKGAKVTREAALKYAQDNGYKDSRGRLDLSKAVKDLTYEDRINVEAEKRAAELSKKADDARVLASAPKPSGTHINVKTDKTLLNQKGQTKNFDEMLADAAADTDMWRQIQRQ